MPRLVGKQSSSGSLYAVLLLLVAVGAAGALEYQGVVNVVPSFGRDYPGEPGFTSSDGQPDTADAPQSGVQNSPQNESQGEPQSAPAEQPAQQPPQ